MATLSEKLQVFQLKVGYSGDDPEKDYAKALRDAITTMDSRIEVEALKALGDLHLEKFRICKELEKFHKSSAMYRAALLRCTDTDVEETIKYRLLYAEKLMRKFLHKQQYDTDLVIQLVRETPVVDESPSTNNVLRVAEICYNLECSHGCNGKNGEPEPEPEEKYVQTLVTSIETNDKLLEIEILKRLGDLYLEDGHFRADISQFPKANAMYENALERCKDPGGKQTLMHRVKYTEKVAEKVTRKAHSWAARRSGDGAGSASAGTGRHIDHPQGWGSYKEHYGRGDNALLKMDLDMAEREFASALRLVHGSQSWLRLEADCLHKIGCIYSERGRVTKEAGHFTKAVALYNAAMVRTKNEHCLKDIIHAIKEAERSFLQHIVGVTHDPSPYGVDTQHKSKLAAMRENVKLQLEAIDKHHGPYQYDEADQKSMIAEAERVDAVKALFQKIVEDRTNFVHGLVSECTDVLGPPPCRYAFIGLGSQATEMLTPYSDLEFALLIDKDADSEENKQYFRNLTHYLHMKVINLGETILPAMGIRCLNDFCSDDSENNWFYDSVTPRGFAFDGAMPWASKTPLGRQETATKKAIELIQTPAKMAEFQRVDVSVSEGYHLSEMLRNVCYMSGDETLVRDYNDILTSDNIRMIDLANHSFLNDDMKKFDKHIHPTAKLIDVKKEMYRFPVITVQHISTSCGISVVSVWKIVDELQKGGNISHSNAHHLKVLLCISAELRLRTYLANGSQRESMSPLLHIDSTSREHHSTVPDLDSVFYLRNRQVLFRYYYTAYPLRAIATLSNAELRNNLMTGSLYLASSTVRAELYRKLCDPRAAQAELESALIDPGLITSASLYLSVIDTLGDVYQELGYHDNSRAFHMFGLKTKELLHEIGADADIPDIAISLNGLGAAWMSLGDHRKAIAFYEQVFRQKRGGPNIASDHTCSLVYLGRLYRDLGELKKAANFTEEALKLSTSKSDDSNYIADTSMMTASILNDLAIMMRDQGDYHKAINYHEQALQTTRQIFGEHAAHPNIAAILDNIANAHTDLWDHRSAINLYEQALNMRKLMYGYDLAHPDIASSLNSLGRVWSDMGDQQKALALYKESLEMYRSIYGQTAAHEHIAGTLRNIGDSWSSTGDHRKAKCLYEQALEMYRRIYGHTKVHPQIASSINSLGAVYSDLGNHKMAYHFYQMALNMRKEIHGQDALHPNIASSLNNIGVALISLDDTKKATGFLERALEMRRLIYGKDFQHPDIATLLTNIGRASLEVGNIEKGVIFHKQALEMKEHIYGHEHLQSARAASSTRGSGRLNVGGDDTGLKSDEKKLDRNERTARHGAIHPSIALSLNGLGRALMKQGDYKAAIAYHEQALYMYRQIHGDYSVHCNIARSLIFLADVWTSIGHHRKGVNIYEQALAMMNKLHGLNASQQDALLLIGRVGEAWCGLGYHKKAIKYFEKALELALLAYGKETVHSHIATMMRALGEARRKSGQLQEAVRLNQKALVMFKQIYGESVHHHDIAISLTNLGAAWHNLNNYGKAISYYKQALVMNKVIHCQGKAHPDIALLLYNMGEVCGDMSDYSRAATYNEEALKMQTDIFGKGKSNQLTARILISLSNACIKLGNFKKAVSCAEEALHMSKHFDSEREAVPYVLMSHINLVMAWSLSENIDKAVRFYKKALEINDLSSGQGLSNPNIAALLEQLKLVFDEPTRSMAFL